MIIYDQKLNKNVVVVDVRTNTWQPILWDADREIDMVARGEFILADESEYFEKE